MAQCTPSSPYVRTVTSIEFHIAVATMIVFAYHYAKDSNTAAAQYPTYTFPIASFRARTSLYLTDCDTVRGTFGRLLHASRR